MSFTQFQTTDRVIDDRMNLFGDELISQITKYSTYDLYLKAGNLMNTQKPTGAGSLVTFSNVTETEQLAFTFNYAIPEQLIISRDNRYNMVIPFEGLESNRSYIFRYLYTHEGTTIFDITRNAVTTATGKFTAEFQVLNQNATDITAEANSTVTLRIYVRTVAGTDAQISLLVNDVNALGRLSRNEATAIISADNVLMPDGVTPVSSAIGQKADKSTEVEKTLLSASWVGGTAPYTYSLTVEGVTATSNQEVLPLTSVTEEQLSSLQGANIQDGGQSVDIIVLKAFGEKPLIDLPIRIILRGDA